MLHRARVHGKSLWSRPTLCDPMDYSLPGSSVRGILQASILEWVAMPSFRALWSEIWCHFLEILWQLSYLLSFFSYFSSLTQNNIHRGCRKRWHKSLCAHFPRKHRLHEGRNTLSLEGCYNQQQKPFQHPKHLGTVSLCKSSSSLKNQHIAKVS